MVICIKKKSIIYFEKNGSELSIRIFDQKKEFESKNNSTIGKSRKKSIDIYEGFHVSSSGAAREREIMLFSACA